MTSDPPLADADTVIRMLGLKPHPEGGHFRETFRDTAAHAGGRNARAASTAIYYLLKAGERSHWHRIDAAEIWHWYAGDPLMLHISADGVATENIRLGPGIADGQKPQAVVPGYAWQAAETLGAWTLVGCTVAPGFEFDRFEMAPTGWRPGLPL